MADVAPRPRWLRTRPGKLLAGALVALALFAAAELTLRLALGPPPPPVRVFSGHEPVSPYFELRDGQVHARYASFASIEPFRPVADRPRVAVLGGSSVRGGTPSLGMADEFPALLGAQVDAEVLNLANPSRDSHDIRRIAAELLADYPVDVLVVYTGHNDFSNTYFHDRYAGAGGMLRARATAGAERLQLYVQLRRLRAGWQGHHGEPPNLTREQLQIAPPLSQARAWATVRYLDANLRAVAWSCRAHDTALVLVTPVCNLLTPPVARDCPASPCAMELWTAAQGLVETDPAGATRQLRAARDADVVPLRAPSFAVAQIRMLADDEGVILIDAEASLRRHGALDVAAEELFVDPVHLSADGHRAMAALLAPAVREALR